MILGVKVGSSLPLISPNITPDDISTGDPKCWQNKCLPGDPNYLVGANCVSVLIDHFWREQQLVCYRTWTLPFFILPFLLFSQGKRLTTPSINSLFVGLKHRTQKISRRTRKALSPFCFFCLFLYLLVLEDLQKITEYINWRRNGTVEGMHDLCHRWSHFWHS